MSHCSSHDPRDELLRQLREQLGRAGTTPSTGDKETTVFSSGAAAVDRWLPGGGLRQGMLVEWLAELPGSGATTMSFLAAREACREGGLCVVIDSQRTFYPPAVAAWGIDLDRLIIVWPRNAREELWAAIQALRSPVVAAVWAPIERLGDRAFRRLQLAAEEGRTLGLFVRPARVRGQPSWADVRMLVSPWSVVRSPLSSNHRLRTTDNHRLRTTDYGRQLQVSLLHCRGARAGGSVVLEIDDANHAIREVTTNHETHSLPVVAKLADSTADSRSARA